MKLSFQQSRNFLQWIIRNLKQAKLTKLSKLLQLVYLSTCTIGKLICDLIQQLTQYAPLLTIDFYLNPKCHDHQVEYFYCSQKHFEYTPHWSWHRPYLSSNLIPNQIESFILSQRPTRASSACCDIDFTKHTT